MNQHAKTALDAIQALRFAATRGDADAVAALVEIGTRAAGHLAALASHPEGYPGRIAADTVAATSERWPVIMDSVREIREGFILPASLGSALPFRTDNSRARNFDPRTRTGFTLSVMRDMDTAGLEPITPDNLEEWLDRAMRHVESDCGGRFEDFPWPDKLRADAKIRQYENAGIEAASRHVVREWLKYGFKQLALTD